MKIAQACPTFRDPMDYTVHGILQARILEWVPFPFSRGSSQPRDQTQVSHIAGRFFASWATRKQPLWKSVAAPQKIKHRIAILSGITTSKQLSRRGESRDSRRYLYTHCIVAVHKSCTQKVYTIHMVIKWWMDKLNVVYPFNGILLSL